MLQRPTGGEIEEVCGVTAVVAHLECHDGAHDIGGQAHTKGLMAQSSQRCHLPSVTVTSLASKEDNWISLTRDAPVVCGGDKTEV
jgi:hypothetical protein